MAIDDELSDQLLEISVSKLSSEHLTPFFICYGLRISRFPS